MIRSDHARPERKTTLRSEGNALRTSCPRVQLACSVAGACFLPAPGSYRRRPPGGGAQGQGPARHRCADERPNTNDPSNKCTNKYTDNYTNVSADESSSNPSSRAMQCIGGKRCSNNCINCSNFPDFLVCRCQSEGRTLAIQGQLL